MPSPPHFVAPRYASTPTHATFQHPPTSWVSHPASPHQTPTRPQTQQPLLPTPPIPQLKPLHQSQYSHALPHHKSPSKTRKHPPYHQRIRTLSVAYPSPTLQPEETYSLYPHETS